MNKQVRKLAGLVLLLFGFSPLLTAQEIPGDFTPFVRLGHVVKISVYREPVLDPLGQNILNPGTLIREEMVNMPVGSGTIISADGLILTNWHVYQITDQIQYDPRTRMLQVAERIGQKMLVYRLYDNDPLKIPLLQYQAMPISLDEEHDTAILRIVADMGDNKIDKNDFSYVSLGNPFGMKINADITVLGYPGKGGDTITITDGKFLGYYRDERFPGLDGFIKTDAAMAPGNSGGAALNHLSLIGVPTAVTLPTQAGSDLGYIHPVTWALKGFVIAHHKFGLRPPEIPLEWITSQYNSDETATRIFVTGSVVSANSGKGLSSQVIATRSDRSLEEIGKLHEDLEATAIIYLAQQMQAYGLSAEEISRQLNLPFARVEEYLASDLSEDMLTDDVRLYLAGEFFYELTESDEEGFFILSVPRSQDLILHVLEEGYRAFAKEFSTSGGKFQQIGRLKIYAY